MSAMIPQFSFFTYIILKSEIDRLSKKRGYHNPTVLQIM
jgi:hypothetical protein